MKRIFTLTAIALLCAAPVLAQEPQDDTAHIAEAEMKAAYRNTRGTGSANTGNYDIIHQALELEADPAVHFISGTVTTDYVAKEAMTQLVFELHNNLTVSAVIQNSVPLAFSHNAGGELVITLPATQAQGTEATVAVTYSGAPPIASDAFVTSSHAGVPILWTLSEPYGAKNWWPCKQDLNDKIESIDVYIRAPQEYVSVSNGVEQSQELHGDGTKTTHFKHDYPIPAYLVAIAISNYAIYNQVAGSGTGTFPIANYIYPEQLATLQPLLDLTPEMVTLFEGLFEPYPYNQEKYGHAQCGFSGGMEHATVSFIGGFSRNVTAHELAHQWFGNKVTCGSWSDLWLNEGFATYLTGLSVQHFDGDDAFRTWRARSVQLITSLGDGSVYVAANDTIDEGRLFSSRLTYNKGAMVVHMLRKKMGDADFFQGLKNYLADPDLAYSYAKTPDLQAHLEAASGLDLQEFFNDWVYGEGNPSYQAVVQNRAPGQAKITLSQEPSHPSVDFFEAEVPIHLFGANGAFHEVVVNHTANGQEFIVEAPFAVTNAVVNYDWHIIAINNSVTLGGNEFSAAQGLKLYPNPAGDSLHLELPEYITVQSAVFYNALGQVVVQSGAAASWDVAGLPYGVYLAEIATNEGVVQLRFIKG